MPRARCFAGAPPFKFSCRLPVYIYTRVSVTVPQPEHPIMPAPRPCLKSIAQLYESSADPLPFASCGSKVLLSPHVHFPPTPILVSTHTTHSSGMYDRAPIAISPNSCALPERGGRTYSPTADSSRKLSSSQAKGSYFHPRAYEACETEPADAAYAAYAASAALPPLVPDLSSSESDESDAPAVTPPETSAMLPPISDHFSQHHHSPIPYAHSREGLDSALSFLPHPPLLVRDKEHLRKRRSPSRPRLAVGSSRRSSKSADDFGQAALDGCLGGF